MHKPVMIAEVLEALDPKGQKTYIDATFGAGGYSRAILSKADNCVVALDRDPEAEKRAGALSKEFAGRFAFVKGRFGEMKRLVPPKKYDGIVFDLGVSSPQIDEAKRGFSFKTDGPLDMRMEKTGLSAADVVNTFDEKEIADILWKYGEERKSRAIARAILKHRPFQTTHELAEVVRSVVGFERPGFDPATRTFQALRLYVNDELGELERGLQASEDLLKNGGRLVVVSFHSLEDRIVKTFLKARCKSGAKVSRYVPERETEKPSFFMKNRKVILPSEAEIKSNPRARSAKLRWAIREGGV